MSLILDAGPVIVSSGGAAVFLWVSAPMSCPLPTWRGPEWFRPLLVSQSDGPVASQDGCTFGLQLAGFFIFVPDHLQDESSPGIFCLQLAFPGPGVVCHLGAWVPGCLRLPTWVATPMG